MRSARLGYRPVAEDDLDLFAAFLADAEATRYLIVPRPHTRAEAAALLERWVERHDGTVGMYTACLAGEVVGWAGFVPRALPWGDELELGWSIRTEHWGNGYATEAAAAVRAWFEAPRMISLISPANLRSQAVARRLGAAAASTIDLPDGPHVIWEHPSAKIGSR